MDTARTLTLGDAAIPRIGLGTNRLANNPANVTFIRAALDAGMRMLDTAHLYVGGESEATIGAALASSSVSRVVATKGGWGGSGRGRPENLRAEIDESLRRLRVEAIDLYYLHRVDPDTPLEESLAAIADYRERGAIRHIGLSEVSIEQIERARAVVPIAAVQNDYSLAERKHDAVVDYCAKDGIVFVPFFPLRGATGAPIEAIAARYGATPTQIALAWLLKRSPTMLPIPGTLSLDHLKDNLAALQIALSEADFEMLR